MKRISTIRKELAIAGVPGRVMRSSEVKALSQILSGDEEIKALYTGNYLFISA